jgi:hypothetical protein
MDRALDDARMRLALVEVRRSAGRREAASVLSGSASNEDKQVEVQWKY